MPASLQLGDIGTPGSIVGNVLVNTGAVLEIRNSDFSGVTTVTNNGNIDFRNTSTAASATFINNHNLDFRNDSSAANATITNNATVEFHGNATAANAVITNNGLVDFVGQSTGGNAQVINNAGAVIDFSGSTGPANDGRLSIGSIAGPGNVYLGANQVTLGGNNLSTTISGVISDCGPTGAECLAVGLPAPSTGGALVKAGTGTLTLTGANTYTGATTVNAGTLIVNGSIVSPATVNAGGTLGGTGQLGSVTTINGGTLSPGNSIGTITINGNLAARRRQLSRRGLAGGGRPHQCDRHGDARRHRAARLRPRAATRRTDTRILSAAGGAPARSAPSRPTGLPAIAQRRPRPTRQPTCSGDADTRVSRRICRHDAEPAGAVAAAQDTAFNAGGLRADLGALYEPDRRAASRARSMRFPARCMPRPRACWWTRACICAPPCSAGCARPPMAATPAWRRSRLGGPQAFADGEELDSALAYAKSPIVTKAPLMAPQRRPTTSCSGRRALAPAGSSTATAMPRACGAISRASSPASIRASATNGRAGIAAGYTGSRNNLDGRGIANVETGHVAGYGGWSFGALNLRAGGAYAFTCDRHQPHHRVPGLLRSRDRAL